MWNRLLGISAARQLPDPANPFQTVSAVSLTIDEVEFWALLPRRILATFGKQITAIRTMRAALDGAAITATSKRGPLLPD